MLSRRGDIPSIWQPAWLLHSSPSACDPNRCHKPTFSIGEPHLNSPCAPGARAAGAAGLFGDRNSRKCAYLNYRVLLDDLQDRRKAKLVLGRPYSSLRLRADTQRHRLRRGLRYPSLLTIWSPPALTAAAMAAHWRSTVQGPYAQPALREFARRQDTDLATLPDIAAAPAVAAATPQPALGPAAPTQGSAPTQALAQPPPTQHKECCICMDAEPVSVSRACAPLSAACHMRSRAWTPQAMARC